MAKFNKITPGSGPSAPLKSAVVFTDRVLGLHGRTVADSPVKTYEGGPGVVSDTKTEAFRLGVTLFGGSEPAFYEKGGRDDRFNSLCAKLAVSDPSWTFGFLRWLRADANIRTAAVMGAAHAVHARLQDKNSVKEDELLSSQGFMGVNRALADAVCQRADEPGEFASYWTSTFGAMPKCVKRGLADAANRTYSEYSVMKYDTSSHAFRFADVLNLTHAKPKGNADLFRYVIDRRFGNDTAVTLPMIAANNSLRLRAAQYGPEVLLDADDVREAGMTWEDVLSLAGSKLPKDKVWESVIPSMGYMALLRNLRNFEEAGISKGAQKYVISKLSDKTAVEKSRQFPFRFLSAYFSINSLAYQSALEDALEYSVQNIPVLDGGTLVLVDTSGSMSSPMSEHSKMTMAGAGALFGGALANRNAGNATLVSFASTSAVVPIPRGGSVLNLVKEIDRRSGEVGHGTQTADAIKRHFDEKKHKRVVIFTDGQSFGGYYGTNIGDCVPAKTFMYGFDLSGYKHTDLAAGNNRRYQLAGLTDATFKQISYLENGENANWPWINKEGK